MLFLGAERTECHSVKSRGDSSQQSVTAKRRDESSASASSRRIDDSTHGCCTLRTVMVSDLSKLTSLLIKTHMSSALMNVFSKARYFEAIMRTSYIRVLHSNFHSLCLGRLVQLIGSNFWGPFD